MESKVILIINIGSSSLKYSIYKNNSLIEEDEFPVIKKFFLKKYLEKICNKLKKEKVEKVIHRIVYGVKVSSPSKITSGLIKKLKPLVEVDSEHMTNSLFSIDFFQKKFPKIKQFAVFDDAFHKTISQEEKTLPFSEIFTKKYKLEKHGFHGIAHEALLKDAQKFLGKKYKKVITLQLGSGASVCAIKNQKSVATTMGYSPVGGIMMQKRSGNLDPEIIFHLEKMGIKPNKLKSIVEGKSGLTEISGLKDMKKIVRNKNKNKKAKLAYDIFIDEIKEQIGSYTTLLKGVDLIVFGGGTNDSKELRRDIFTGLDFLGIKIDNIKAKEKLPKQISKGKTKVVVIKTNENKLMFEKCKNL